MEVPRAALHRNSLYHGETYDARRETPGWDRPGFDDADWSATVALDVPFDQLVAQNSPTIQVTEEVAPVSITEPAEGVYVFDFGQNLAGRARLKVTGPVGTRVQIRFAEVLKPDGNIYTANYRGARVTDVYYLKGDGEEVWEPRFTYRGFRYAEVTGYPGTLPKDALVAQVFHSAAPVIGHFECADRFISRIQHNILLGPTLEHAQRAHGLSPARRTARLDGRRPGIRAHGLLEHEYGGLLREMDARHP